MAPKSSSDGGTSSLRSKLQTHNVQHSLRAGAQAKLSRQQKERQEAAMRQQQQPSSSAESSSAFFSMSRPAPCSILAGSSREQLENLGGHSLPRKVTFKQVLGSPLMVNWPALSPVSAQAILYTLLDVLRHPKTLKVLQRASISRSLDRRDLTRSERRRRRSKWNKQSEPEPQHRTESSTDIGGDEMDVDKAEARSSPLIIGINTVTRRLEQEISMRSNDSGLEDAKAGALPSLDLVFVCRADLDPPRLTAHFPLLACAVNAVCHPESDHLSATQSALRLVSLPEGAEHLLADALNLRRCGVLGLATSCLVEEVGLALLRRIEETDLLPPRAGWLEVAAGSAVVLRNQTQCTPPARDRQQRFSSLPKVLQIAITAPANPKAVKMERKHTRAEKKAWRKARRRDIYIASVRRVKRRRKRDRTERRQLRLGV